MPTLKGLWRAIRRFVRTNPSLADPIRRSVKSAEMRKDCRARRKSLALLLRLMSPEQRQQFRQSGSFYVVGGSTGDLYRIRSGKIANIDVLRDESRVKWSLCAHPKGVPMYDVMAAQLLHLQDPLTEKRFLLRANDIAHIPENWHSPVPH